ncbi:A-kinase anchor protein 7 isoform X1 [Mobula hypostoma]|uniref:A-kinase anchor protein 7 isoform X1 n=1 Tax=Mobula hypostoma TaxID=723540 RepID=UPI002FC2D5FF
MPARFHLTRLFAKCQREDLDTSRTLRRLSDLLSLRETGRRWPSYTCCVAFVTHSRRSLHLTLGRERFAINLADLQGERSAPLKPSAWIPCSLFVGQRGFKCFGESSDSRVALSRPVTRRESLSKCKSRNHLRNIYISNHLNFLKRHSVSLQEEFVATVLKPRETNRSIAAESAGSMETSKGKTLDEDHCSMSMECDQQSIEEVQSVFTSDSDLVSAEDSSANIHRLFSDINTAELLGNDVPDGTQTADDKRKRPKVKKRKKNKSAEEKEVSSLLAELPFPNAEIREEYGFTKAPVKNSKKKRKRTLGGETDEDAGQIKKKKVHPNYFVSIPITNPKIVGGIKAVQDLVVQADERLSKAVIPISCLHITILVTYLASDVEVNKAVSTIEECKEPVQEILLGTQLALGFDGIADFRGEVVFAQLIQNEHLSTLVQITETIRQRFQANGILIADSRAFKPHLTFMKLSRAPKLHHQGIKKISPELYKNFKNHYFGDEIVTCLQLCSMLKKKQPNGYYHCETTLAVGEKNESEPDEEELVSLSKRLVETAVIKAVQQYLEETQSKTKQNTNGQNISSKCVTDTDPNNGNKK